MKKIYFILLRILATFMDYLIVYIPVVFIVSGILKYSERQSLLIFQLLFAVYGVITNDLFRGSFGKVLAKLEIVDNTNKEKISVLNMGIRELLKSFYVIPFIGWTLAIINLCFIFFRKDNRALHDIVGNSCVVIRGRVR